MTNDENVESALQIHQTEWARQILISAHGSSSFDIATVTDGRPVLLFPVVGQSGIHHLHHSKAANAFLKSTAIHIFILE